MRDRKVMVKPRVQNGFGAEDLLETVDSEYIRRNFKPTSVKNYEARRPYSRDRKMHRQHFKWSYHVSRPGRAS